MKAMQYLTITCTFGAVLGLGCVLTGCKPQDDVAPKGPKTSYGQAIQTSKDTGAELSERDKAIADQAKSLTEDGE